MSKNSKLKNIARQLRRNETPAEKLLWSRLRRNNLSIPFRRQMPFVFGRYHYVADFYCRKYSLIVEVDGGIHDDREIKEIDEFREQIFTDMGYKTIRFTNNEVLYDTNNVIARIKQCLK